MQEIQSVAEVYVASSDIGDLEIRAIRRDGNTQGRATLSHAVVEEYASLMNSGVEFPPVRVWFDDGDNYWLSDGFQRTAAAELIGRTSIAALILRGSLNDARWDSYGANSKHGLRRTRTDIHSIIMRALEHPRSAQLSNNELGRHLNIPEPTVRRWRGRLAPDGGQDPRVAVRNGKEYFINIGRIGSRSGSQRTRPQSLFECKRDLREMRDLASPRALPMFSMLEGWILGRISITVCLEGIESICLEPGKPSVCLTTVGVSSTLAGASKTLGVKAVGGILKDGSTSAAARL